MIENLYKHPLHHVWTGIKQRCLNKNNPFHKRYGGRGIKLCYEWWDYFPFYNWAINNGWQKGLQLDRIDNNGNYEPCNCRFTTRKINSNNRRDTVIVNHNGIEKPLRIVCDELGLKGKLVWQMMDRKRLSFDQAIKHYLNV